MKVLDYTKLSSQEWREIAHQVGERAGEEKTVEDLPTSRIALMPVHLDPYEHPDDEVWVPIEIYGDWDDWDFRKREEVEEVMER